LFGCAIQELNKRFAGYELPLGKTYNWQTIALHGGHGSRAESPIGHPANRID
jgi:hypothetical protein